MGDWARWRSLELTLHMIEPPPARNLQSCTKNHKLGLWRKNLKNERYFSWANHRWSWRCWRSPWDDAGASLLLLLFLLQSFLQSFLSQVLGFILVLECREREWGWSGVASADEGFQLVLTSGSKQCKWKTAHFPLTFIVLQSVGRSSSSSGLSGGSLSLLDGCSRCMHWQGRLS